MIMERTNNQINPSVSSTTLVTPNARGSVSKSGASSGETIQPRMPIGTVASAQTPRILAREYCSLIDSYPGATPKRILCYQTGSGLYSPKCLEGAFSEVR